MQPMTYLELVNMAVIESKVSLDKLTAANFSDPPRTIMYSRFKDWVNNVYEELFEERKEWYFRKERAIFPIYPRLHLGGVSSTLAVGDILEGQSSGISFEVVDTHTHEDAHLTPATELTVSVVYRNYASPSQLVIREQFNRINNTPEANVGYLIGLGYYDFTDDVAGLQSIDMDSVSTQEIPSDSEGTRLYQAPRSMPVRGIGWPNPYEVAPVNGQYPQYIAETPYGSYALYPQPSEGRLISFDYSKEFTPLETWDDIPVDLPKEFHKYLAWRAVEEFADFDSNQSLYRRAHKHVLHYRQTLDRDEIPDLRFAPSKFSRY